MASTPVVNLMIHASGPEDLGAYFLELEGLLDRVERSTNHYQVLGRDRSASGEEINLSHRQAMGLLNPADLRNATLPSSLVNRITKAWEKVSQAYLVLSHYGTRVEYDNSLLLKVRVPITIDFTGVGHNPNPRPENGATGSLSNDNPASPGGTTSPELTEGPGSEAAANSTADSKAGASSTKANSDPEVICIKHGGGQVVFTKLKSESERGNRRRYHRLRLSVPTYVTGHDRAKGKWTEVAHTLDVSVGGVALQLSEEMKEGAVLHLILPMPTKLRRHGHSEPTYQVYAIVRRVEVTRSEKRVVGLEFIGGSPPPGYLEKPWAKFRTQW